MRRVPILPAPRLPAPGLFFLIQAVALVGSGAKKEEEKEANSTKPSVREERPVGTTVTETVRTILHPSLKEIDNKSFSVGGFLVSQDSAAFLWFQLIGPLNGARVWVRLWPQPLLREGFIFCHSY